MRKWKVMLVGVLFAFALGSPAWADWTPGDPFKMHFPQLPDLNGWDVNCTTVTVADDWMCTQTGPVSDIHIWVSCRGDDPVTLTGITLGIWSNIPAGATYSRPGQLLWSRSFTQWNSRFYGAGSQGWYDPAAGVWNYPDHSKCWQFNFTNIQDPYVQQGDSVYWLSVSAIGPYGFGWKTSFNHFMDDAVWGSGPTGWQEIRDPRSNESLDMAFVITSTQPPVVEPAIVGALGLALLSLRKRRN